MNPLLMINCFMKVRIKEYHNILYFSYSLMNPLFIIHYPLLKSTDKKNLRLLRFLLFIQGGGVSSLSRIISILTNFDMF